MWGSGPFFTFTHGSTDAEGDGHYEARRGEEARGRSTVNCPLYVLFMKSVGRVTGLYQRAK